MNFILKVFENSKKVQRVQTHSIRRFLKNARTITGIFWPKKVYLKVTYGKFPDINLKPTVFYNDGWYEENNEFWVALNAFTENDYSNINKSKSTDS